jgi:hypothetical protein
MNFICCGRKAVTFVLIFSQPSSVLSVDRSGTWDYFFFGVAVNVAGVFWGLHPFQSASNKEALLANTLLTRGILAFNAQ